MLALCLPSAAIFFVRRVHAHWPSVFFDVNIELHLRGLLPAARPMHISDFELQIHDVTLLLLHKNRIYKYFHI